MAGMAIASVIISAVSAAAQAANSYQNLQQQAKAADANAKIAENNARLKLVEGNYAQDTKLQEGKQYISRQYVGNLQSGAGGAGTTGDRAVAKSVYNLENDLNLLSYNYSTQAIDFLNQSKMYKYESKVAKANAVNSLLMGGLNVGNSIMASKSINSGNNNSVSSSGSFQASPTTQELSRPIYARNSKLWL